MHNDYEIFCFFLKQICAQIHFLYGCVYNKKSLKCALHGTCSQSVPKSKFSTVIK